MLVNAHDGGFDAVQTGASVDDQRNSISQLGQHVRRTGRADSAKAIRAWSGDRLAIDP